MTIELAALVSACRRCGIDGMVFGAVMVGALAGPVAAAVIDALATTCVAARDKQQLSPMEGR